MRLVSTPAEVSVLNFVAKRVRNTENGHSIAVALACLMASVATSVLPSPVYAEPAWPRFRGADATGVVADNASLPDRWSETENVVWKRPIKGWGWSSPVVAGDRLFLTAVHADDEFETPKPGLYLGRGRSTPPDVVMHWMVYCLSLATGDVIWQHEVHTGKPEVPRHPKSTYASETPVVDDDRVYAVFGDLGIFAFDHDGTPAWQQSIEAQPTFFDYGAAASPVLHQDQLIMVYDNQKSSYIAAFDTATGAERWRVPREEKSTWATPFIWTSGERTEIVTAGKREIRSYDLQGKVLWHFAGRMSNLTIPSPFAVDDLLYITSGYVGDAHRPVYAISPGGAGDIGLAEGEDQNDFIRWYQPQAGPYNTSPIVYRGLYYTLHDRGFLTCHDAKTGEEVFGKKRFAPGASFTSSPWAYNGKLFFLSESGDTYVVRAGRDFELLNTNSLDELCIATPSIAEGKLLLRTAAALYCIANPEDE